MLTREEFEKLQSLARLRLNEEEGRLLVGHLEQILAYIRRLETLAEGASLPPAEAGERRLPLRADEPKPGLSAEEALSGAPDFGSGAFRAPWILTSEDPE